MNPVAIITNMDVCYRNLYQGYGGSAAYLCRYEDPGTRLVNKVGIYPRTFRSTSTLTGLDPSRI